MRNKQLPIKSSRHKSVASMINCPEISFQREHRQSVMRLAFFENNDITPDTWKDFDFNTLSSLILNRNIHHDLHDQPKPTVSVHRVESPKCASKDNIQQLSPPTQSPQYEYNFDYEYSPQPVHSPPPVHVRRPPNAARSTSASTSRSVNNFRSTSGVPRQAHSIKADTNNIRLASISKATHFPRATSISKQQQQQTQHLDASVESGTPTSHSGQYLCEEPDCGKTFPSLRKLRHHKVVHSDDFPFMCQFQSCGKRFKRKFGIDLHSTTHFDLDVEMYEKTSNNSSLEFFGRRMQYSLCKQCNQKFKTVHEYQDHMLKHGKEPFKCLVEGCGQTFSIWKSFQKHRASHYFNYYCKMDSQCNHSTSNLQLLKLHIYCCHFRRTLPENATLSSGQSNSYESADEQPVDDVDQMMDAQPMDDELFDDNELEDPLSLSQEPEVSTPRRDPRLRRNPPKSSNFKHQDIDEQQRKHLRQVNTNKGSLLVFN